MQLYRSTVGTICRLPGRFQYAPPPWPQIKLKNGVTAFRARPESTAVAAYAMEFKPCLVTSLAGNASLELEPVRATTQDEPAESTDLA